MVDNIRIVVITLFVIGVGAVLMRTEHKNTLLLVLGVSALIFVITTMKGETVSMGEG